MSVHPLRRIARPALWALEQLALIAVLAVGLIELAVFPRAVGTKASRRADIDASEAGRFPDCG